MPTVADCRREGPSSVDKDRVVSSPPEPENDRPPEGDQRRPKSNGTASPPSGRILPRNPSSLAARATRPPSMPNSRKASPTAAEPFHLYSVPTVAFTLPASTWPTP